MITTYFLKCIAEDIFKHQETPNIPYDFYLALSSTEPALDGTGVTEPMAESGYIRARIDNSNLIFGEASDDAIVSNHTKVYFPETITPWENITHYAIFDAAKNGNLLMYGALNETMNVPIKTIISIPINALQIAVANEVT